MKKITSIIFILIFFALFCVFEFIEHSGNHVLKVFSPTVIGVDFNNNDKIDENETICIPDVESFTANIPLNPVNTAKSMNISLADSLSAGYLADEFANKTLLNKKVKLRLTSKRTTDCRFAEIYINNEKLDAPNDLGKAALAGLAEYPISLDKNEYFLLGDNRSGSEDSRFSNVGNVKFRQIKGKVWLRIQPVSRFGLISSR